MKALLRSESSCERVSSVLGIAWVSRKRTEGQSRWTKARPWCEESPQRTVVDEGREFIEHWCQLRLILDGRHGRPRETCFPAGHNWRCSNRATLRSRLTFFVSDSDLSCLFVLSRSRKQQMAHLCSQPGSLATITSIFRFYYNLQLIQQTHQRKKIDHSDRHPGKVSLQMVFASWRTVRIGARAGLL